jgi:hypothetical protein
MQDDNQPTQPQAPSAPQVPTNQTQPVTQPEVPQSPTPESTQTPPEIPKPKSNRTLMIGVVLLLLAVTGAATYLLFQNQSSSTEKPTSYDECTKAEGSVIQESYPATCVTKNGDRFLQPLTDEEKKNLQPQTTPTPAQPLDELAFGQDQMLDWKIHTESTYKFSYPPDADLTEQEASVVVLSKWGPTQTEATELFDGYSISFKPREAPDKSLNVNSLTGNLIAEIENLGISKVISGPDQIVIGKYEGLTFTEEGLGTFKHIILGDDQGILVEISTIVSDPGGLGFSEIVDMILSSFEFGY